MEKLIAVMADFPDGFTIINKDGRIIYWNPALEKITGIKSEEVVAKLVWEIQARLMPTVYKGAFLESQKRFWETSKSELLLESKDEDQSELDFIRSDGGSVTVSMKYYTTRVNRHSLFICATIRDFTEQKKKEKALENMGRSANHDIKNQMQTVIGFSNLLLDEPEYELAEASRPFVQIIRDAGLKACAISEKSMIFDRLELGNFALAKNSIKLNVFLTDLLKEIAKIEKRYEVKIEIAPDPKIMNAPIAFAADQDLLQSVLDNLLINAAEAALKDNKMIGVTVNIGQELIFVVSNNGEIPHEIRPRLFQKGATCGKSNGNGFGLYFSRLIVQAHGGNISYSSKNGKTLFIVRIPVQ